MTVLLVYLLFAVTTAIAAVYEIFWPALTQLEITNPKDVLVENKLVSLIVMFFGALAVAPLMFPIVIVPQFGERFRNSITGPA